MKVTVGIDSHKFSLGVGVIDEVGRGLGASDFVNAPQQWEQMLEWIGGFGEIDLIGIEGSGQYGAGLAGWLMERGFSVKEVPAHMTFQERKRRPSQGKSDPTDGLRITQVVLREGDLLPSAGRDSLATDLKAAVEHRDQLIRARTQHANRAHALLSAIRPSALGKVKLTTAKGLTKAVAVVRGDRQVRAELVRSHVAEIRRLTRQIQRADQLLAQLVETTGSSLTDQVGVGTLIAAKILAETRGLGRVRSEGGFAMLSGTAPIPASSGQVTRHRLNRGGNRRLNHAIHMVAVNRLRLDPKSRSYFERKIAEGKSRKEALRALKRHVASRIFRCLDGDAKRATQRTIQREEAMTRAS